MKTLAVLRLALALAFAPSAEALAADRAPSPESVARDVAASFPDDATGGWKIGAIERHREGSETHFCVGVESDGTTSPRASYLFQYAENGVLVAAYVRGSDGRFSLLFT